MPILHNCYKSNVITGAPKNMQINVLHTMHISPKRAYYAYKD